MSAFLLQMQALSAAEEFFAALAVPFDPQVVQVKRLHILKRFNEQLAGLDQAGRSDEALRSLYSQALAAAYAAVQTAASGQPGPFKVFRQAAPSRTFVPLDAVRR